MRKIVTILFLLHFALTTQGQSSFFKAVKLYYRVNPFDRKYSAMLNNILTDTGFVRLDMKKRTDSNFFFLSGYYKRFNPFDFIASQTQLRIAEQEILHNDSLQTLDTIINYQLLGIVNGGDESKMIVQKEVTRFHKRFSYDFASSNYNEAFSNGLVTAAVYNYFIFGRKIPAMSVAWGKMPGQEAYTFTITIRLKIIENFADLPRLPGEPF